MFEIIEAASPDVLFRGLPLIVPVQHMYHADLLQSHRGKLTDRYINDGPSEARGDTAEDGAGRPGSHVYDISLERIIQARQQQPLGFALGEIVIGVAPDVEHAARRQAHQETAVLAAADAGSHHVVKR